MVAVRMNRRNDKALYGRYKKSRATLLLAFITRYEDLNGGGVSTSRFENALSVSFDRIIAGGFSPKEIDGWCADDSPVDLKYAADTAMALSRTIGVDVEENDLRTAYRFSHKRIPDERMGIVAGIIADHVTNVYDRMDITDHSVDTVFLSLEMYLAQKMKPFDWDMFSHIGFVYTTSQLRVMVRRGWTLERIHAAARNGVDADLLLYLVY